MEKAARRRHGENYLLKRGLHAIRGAKVHGYLVRGALQDQSKGISFDRQTAKLKGLAVVLRGERAYMSQGHD